MKVCMVVGCMAATLSGGASCADEESIVAQLDRLDDLNKRLNAVEARETGLQEVLMTSYLATTVPCVNAGLKPHGNPPIFNGVQP